LLARLADALQDGGLNVTDVGMVATPMLYYAAHTLTQGSGVMLTGSHNPPQYNGLKMMLAGTTLSGDSIQDLYQAIVNGKASVAAQRGSFSRADVANEYRERIQSDIQLARPMNIVIDAGNGVAGAYAGDVYRALGCSVTELFCEVDGTFPNHHPDPAKPANLQDLIHALQTSDAEIGLAFDGDGDRLGVVTKDGNIIWPDRQLMLYAADVLKRQPQAKIIYDVKCTRLLAPWIREHGGEPIISRTGHSLIKAAMKEHQAALAGEMSGHTFFKERWFGFDDGMYTGARLLEILSQSADASAVLNALPEALSTPELNINMASEGDNHRIIATLQQNAQFPQSENIIDIDGLRVEYADGFGLIRASNTTPVLVLRFEAETEAALAAIQAEFKQVLQQVGLNDLPF
jgi:phosphomannomutase